MISSRFLVSMRMRGLEDETGQTQAVLTLGAQIAETETKTKRRERAWNAQIQQNHLIVRHPRQSRWISRMRDDAVTGKRGKSVGSVVECETIFRVWGRDSGFVEEPANRDSSSVVVATGVGSSVGECSVAVEAVAAVLAGARGRAGGNVGLSDVLVERVWRRLGIGESRKSCSSADGGVFVGRERSSDRVSNSVTSLAGMCSSTRTDSTPGVGCFAVSADGLFGSVQGLGRLGLGLRHCAMACGCVCAGLRESNGERTASGEKRESKLSWATRTGKLGKALTGGIKERFR